MALWTAAGLLLLSIAGLMILRFPARAARTASVPPTLHDALGGLRFIRAQPVILAAVALDLFAVLFGGATALRPAYADTILLIGPAGLGLLRSAPAVENVFIGAVPAVVAGGVATLAVVGVCPLAFPQLRRFDRFAGGSENIARAAK